MATVLITGCSTGIGRESALAFARHGDRVHATMRDLAKAEELRARAARENLPLRLHALDVTDEAAVTAVVRAVEEEHGGLDVLVNNAGVDHTGAVETTPWTTVHTLFDTNLWGPLRTIRAALPAMRARRAGTIVNISSLAAHTHAIPHGGLYAASKAALGALSEALAAETAPYGIRVLCPAPGSHASAIHDRPATPAPDGPYTADEAWTARFLAHVAKGAADPREAAEALVRAVHDPRAPLHTPIGADAEATLAGRPSHEDWLPVFLTHAQALTGPRPTP
ncbi:SDR family oxidoreductase (plasmid) [Streptomyces sp. BI20]|uniref:SDR family oxidoreductase n=1 Tax=Streptomyces sp. BI20 TaxID=3403460 RepID=UPI003C7182C5